MTIPYFEKTEVGGFTPVELDAIAEMGASPGWKVAQKYLDAILAPVRPAVYTNVDPDRQLLLHQGLGAIYVAENLREFVASASSEADRLLQRELSAAERAEPAKADEV